MPSAEPSQAPILWLFMFSPLFSGCVGGPAGLEHEYAARSEKFGRRREGYLAPVAISPNRVVLLIQGANLAPRVGYHNAVYTTHAAFKECIG